MPGAELYLAGFVSGAATALILDHFILRFLIDWWNDVMRHHRIDGR